MAEKPPYQLGFYERQIHVLIRQQEAQTEAQMKLIETLTQRLNVQPEATRPTYQTNSVDVLCNSFTEFSYAPDCDHFRSMVQTMKTPGKSVSSSENLELTNTQGFSTTSCRNILKTSSLMKQYSSFLRYSMPGYRALTRSALLDKIIRVDHAGETGARKIYEGQLFVLGKSNVAPIIKEMCDQEEHHLRKFQELIPRYRVRPTALLPFWNLAGLLVGIGSAALGPRYAMACTVAVESVISEHYNNQIRSLVEQDPKGSEELLQILKQFRDEEIEHHDIGLQHDAEKAFGYNLFSNMIKAGCRASISLAELI